MRQLWKQSSRIFVMTPSELMKGLPGAALVQKGLSDLELGRLTVAGCLVQIAAPRLRRAGLMTLETCPAPESELQLYRLLREEKGDAYSRYNALLRELVSF